MKIMEIRLVAAAAGAALLTTWAAGAHAHYDGTCHSHADDKVCEDDGSAGTAQIDAPAMQLYIPYRNGRQQGVATFGAKKGKTFKPRRKRLRRR